MPPVERSALYQVPCVYTRYTCTYRLPGTRYDTMYQVRTNLPLSCAPTCMYKYCSRLRVRVSIRKNNKRGVGVEAKDSMGVFCLTTSARESRGFGALSVSVSMLQEPRECRYWMMPWVCMILPTCCSSSTRTASRSSW